MKIKSFILLALVSLSTLDFQLSKAQAQGTAFTYQGRLNNGGSAANGSYDLSFTVYDAVTGGNLIGSLTNSATSVSNGLFTAALDFGGVFTGTNYWLEIGARTNGNGTFVTLSPRQSITPTPYAIYSASAGSAVNAGTAGSANSVLAANISGTLALTQLPGAVVATNSTNVNLSGNFSGGTITGSSITGSTITGTNIYWSSASYLRDDQGGAIELGNSVKSGATPYIDFHYGTGTFQDYNVRLINDASSQLSVLGNLRVTGTVSGNGSGLTKLPAFAVTNNESGVNITGTFTGTGAGLTNVDLLNVNSHGAINIGISWQSNYVGNFTLGSMPAVTSYPQFIVATDVNGDGKPDLITGNGGSLQVVTNNGDGTFTFDYNEYLPGGNGLSSYVAADVNGDGKMDLIGAGGTFQNNLIVLTNDGTGFFTASQTISANRPVGIAAADVNGDGKVDLICADSGGNTITVLTNNGSGVFSLNATYTVGNGPVSVVAFTNSSGLVDLATANESDNTLTVLTNNGSGGFALACTPKTGLEPADVIAADINGTGIPELINVNYAYGTLMVFTNNGSSLYSSNSIYSTGASSVIAADVNGDGRPDLISSSSFGNNLTVLTNNGSGGFALAAMLSTTYPFGVAAADVNGDGRPDLIVPNQTSSGTLSVFINSPVGSISGYQGNFSGNGSNLTGLNASQLSSGTVPLAQLSGITSTQLNAATWQLTTNLNGGNAALATNVVAGISITNAFITNSIFAGNGGGLTNLNGASVAGQVPLADLPAGIVTNTETGVALTGIFNGNGGSLTNLNGAKLTGQISQTNLPAAAVTNTETGVTLAGTFSGNGGGLTSLPFNVAMLSSNQIFTGFNTFATTNFVISNNAVNPVLTIIGHGGGGATVAVNLDTYSVGANPPSSQILATDDGNLGNTVDVMTKPDGNITNVLVSRLHISSNGSVGIGTSSPASALHVVASGDTEISIQSSDGGAHRWTLQGSGTNTPSLASSFQIIDRTKGVSRLLIDTNGVVHIGSNYASSGTENLRIIRGLVQYSGGVLYTTGAGFTAVRNSTGSYTINFSPGFTDSEPTMTITPWAGGSVVIPVISYTLSTTAPVNFYNTSGTLTDPTAFNFIVVGTP